MQQAFISDSQAREEALNPTQSFIVQAPAGSGKTALLIQRLLILLTHAVTAPEECLAITFTRKAAAEMRDRIISALQRAKYFPPPSDVHEKKLWDLAKAVLIRDERFGWDLLNNPSRLRIQTIDAFCAGIVWQMPILSQFGSIPEIVENAASLYQKAARNLLKALESDEPWSEAVRSLLVHLDNNLVLAERLLAEMLAHRDQWLPYVGQSFAIKNARAFLENGLENVVQEALLLLRSSVPDGFEAILNLARESAQNIQSLPETKKRTDILHCLKLSNDWPGTEVADLPLWQGLGELLLTQDHQWRKTLTEQQGFPAPSQAEDATVKAYLKARKGEMSDILEKLQAYPLFRENLQKMRECPPLKYEDNQWQIVKALVQLLPVLTAKLTVIFQEQAKVDFIEITLAALRALGESESPTDIALSLDYKIHHILMDEFQDTSLSQFRLIEQLTAGWQPGDGRTLFLVGDPMQSIYRFRQAEVGLFIRARQQGIGGIILKFLNLTANFRSDPKLVAWNNRVFSHKFPLQDDMTSSAIAFSASSATQVSSKEAEVVSEVVTVETEAKRVEDLIKTHQEADPTLSIALLVRSRLHLQEILPTLRQAGIAYQGIDLELLTNRSIVQDLLALTRALFHLGDRIAWLALLRSPWIALSLSDLVIIANFDLRFPLWHALQSYTELKGISEEGQARLAAVVPILAKALLYFHHLPLRTCITETWLALGGLQLLPDAQSLQDAEAFLEILEEEDPRFQEVGVLEQRVEVLYAKPKDPHPQAVQVMTIHKAKGLEFDMVIVPGVGRRSVSDRAKLLLWEERVSFFRESYFILAPIKPVGAKEDPIYTYLRQQEKRRADYEALRVEYVAATRARRKLYWLTYKEKNSFTLGNHEGRERGFLGK